GPSWLNGTSASICDRRMLAFSKTTRSGQSSSAPATPGSFIRSPLARAPNTFGLAAQTLASRLSRSQAWSPARPL
ncbi:hypothetical protein FOTG_19114, partial [Fusarium oxysporum f. sp. vasinfectum 25433]